MADQGRIPTDPMRPVAITREEVIAYLWRVGSSRAAREARAERAYHRLLRGDLSAVGELRACHREAETQAGLALEMARAMAPARRPPPSAPEPPLPPPRLPPEPPLPPPRLPPELAAQMPRRSWRARLASAWRELWR